MIRPPQTARRRLSDRLKHTGDQQERERREEGKKETKERKEKRKEQKKKDAKRKRKKEREERNREINKEENAPNFWEAGLFSFFFSCWTQTCAGKVKSKWNAAL